MAVYVSKCDLCKYCRIDMTCPVYENGIPDYKLFEEINCKEKCSKTFSFKKKDNLLIYYEDMKTE